MLIASGCMGYNVTKIISQQDPITKNQRTNLKNQIEQELNKLSKEIILLHQLRNHKNSIAQKIESELKTVDLTDLSQKTRNKTNRLQKFLIEINKVDLFIDHFDKILVGAE